MAEKMQIVGMKVGNRRYIYPAVFCKEKETEAGGIHMCAVCLSFVMLTKQQNFNMMILVLERT